MRPAIFAPVYGWCTEGFEKLDLKGQDLARRVGVVKAVAVVNAD